MYIKRTEKNSVTMKHSNFYSLYVLASYSVSVPLICLLLLYLVKKGYCTRRIKTPDQKENTHQINRISMYIGDETGTVNSKDCDTTEGIEFSLARLSESSTSLTSSDKVNANEGATMVDVHENTTSFNRYEELHSDEVLPVIDYTNIETTVINDLCYDNNSTDQNSSSYTHKDTLQTSNLTVNNENTYHCNQETIVKTINSSEIEENSNDENEIKEASAADNHFSEKDIIDDIINTIASACENNSSTHSLDIGETQETFNNKENSSEEELSKKQYDAICISHDDMDIPDPFINIDERTSTSVSISETEGGCGTVLHHLFTITADQLSSGTEVDAVEIEG